MLCIQMPKRIARNLVLNWVSFSIGFGDGVWRSGIGTDVCFVMIEAVRGKQIS